MGSTADSSRKHSHYFKPVAGLATVDVYRVLLLFGVTDPCLQHAIKKLLVAGGRGGGKDISRDVREARETLERWEEMRGEEQASAESQETSKGITELITKGAATPLRTPSEEPHGKCVGREYLSNANGSDLCHRANCDKTRGHDGEHGNPCQDGNPGVCDLFGCTLDRGHKGAHGLRCKGFVGRAQLCSLPLKHEGACR